jgi:response regulator of citrate/malate metabolism
MENTTQPSNANPMNLDELFKVLTTEEKEVILPKDDLLTILQNLTRKAPAIPEGFMNAEQYAKKWNIHVSTVRPMLKKGLEKGLLEMKVYYAKTNHFDRVGRPSAHYRQKR